MAPFSTFLARQHPISLNVFRVLMLIGTYGATAIHQLIEQTGVNAMSISKAVAKPENNGSVKTLADPRDRTHKQDSHIDRYVIHVPR